MDRHPAFPTSEARKALASRFGLWYDDSMQDWEWEVANAEHFDEYLAAYAALPEDQRFSLMEMLIQCVEDTKSELTFAARWNRLVPLLEMNQSLHEPTIEYWACRGATDPEEAFRISGKMRRVGQGGSPVVAIRGV